MPRSETILDVFLASPSDLKVERKLVENVLAHVNLMWRTSIGISFNLIKWETHVTPGIGKDAQDVINQQISENYDVFIGMMGRRFGSPTLRAPSGTVEEFTLAHTRFIEHGHPDILFYFKDQKISQSEINIEEERKIFEFRSSLSNVGILYGQFKNKESFRYQLTNHLSHIAKRYAHNNSTAINTAAAGYRPSARGTDPIALSKAVMASLKHTRDQSNEYIHDMIEFAGIIAEQTGAFTPTLQKMTLEVRSVINAPEPQRARLSREQDIRHNKIFIDHFNSTSDIIRSGLPKYREDFEKFVNCQTLIISLGVMSFDARPISENHRLLVNTLMDSMFSTNSKILDLASSIEDGRDFSPEMAVARRKMIDSHREFVETSNEYLELLQKIIKEVENASKE